MERTAEDDGKRLEGPSGTELDRDLWRQFVQATSPKAFCQSWLPLQCRMLRGVRCGMVLLGNSDRGPFTPVAVWPDAKLSMTHLTGAAERALRERRGLLSKGTLSLPLKTSILKRSRLLTPSKFPESFTVLLSLRWTKTPAMKCRPF